MAKPGRRKEPIEFYNPELKMRFFATKSEDYQNRNQKYLSRAGKYENAIKKDLSAMNRDEFIELLTRQKYISLITIDDFWMAIKDYLVWYCTNIKVIPAEWLLVSSRDVRAESYVDEIFVKSIDDICELNKIIPVSSGRPFVPLLILAYHGINLNRAVALKRKCVFFENRYARIICDGGDVIEVRGDAADILQEYDQFSVIDGDPTRKSRCVRRIYDDVFIYRLDTGKNVTTDKRQSSLTEMNKMRKTYNLGLKYTARQALIAGRMWSYREYEETHGNLPDAYIAKRIHFTEGKSTLVIASDRFFYNACKKGLWIE